jgi:hypothetical protein
MHPATRVDQSERHRVKLEATDLPGLGSLPAEAGACCRVGNGGDYARNDRGSEVARAGAGGTINPRSGHCSFAQHHPRKSPLPLPAMDLRGCALGPPLMCDCALTTCPGVLLRLGAI